MTNKSILPDKVYVTLKEQPVFDNGVIVAQGPLLGFLNAYDPKKKSWPSMKNIQIEWAYSGNLRDFKWEDLGGDDPRHLWITGISRKYFHDSIKSRFTHTDVTEARWAYPAPRLLDNTPLTGFKIERSVTRYSTSNKLWRISDPRGFELEISTACLEDIMMASDIKKGGEIVAPCAWLANKKLVVV